MDDFYKASKPKDLKSHFEVMGKTGLHLMSVAYRGEQDMTIWINGRGRDDRLELEWSELFPADNTDTGVDVDAGVDAGSEDASDGASEGDDGASEGDSGAVQDYKQDADANGGGSVDESKDKGGCSSCNSPGEPGGFGIWIFLGFLLVWASSKSNQERNR